MINLIKASFSTGVLTPAIVTVPVGREVIANPSHIRSCRLIEDANYAPVRLKSFLSTLSIGLSD